MERDAIRGHLRRRMWRFLAREALPASALLEMHVGKVQARLQRDYHRRKPPIGVRRTAPRAQPPEAFTRLELELLVDLFVGANDPVTRGIAEKAERMLGR